jgi:hypothetical protein
VGVPDRPRGFGALLEGAFDDGAQALR